MGRNLRKKKRGRKAGEKGERKSRKKGWENKEVKKKRGWGGGRDKNNGLCRDHARSTEVELKERKKKWLFTESNLRPLTLKPGSQ